MKSTISHRLLKKIGNAGTLRSRELDAYGIDRKYLERLCQAGKVSRVGRGLYRLADYQPTEKTSLAQIAKRVPNGVFCLISALQFHDITTQQAYEVWLAIDRKDWRPRIEEVPLRVVRFSGPAMTKGIEVHKIENVPVKVYCVAKTVADCFKYRNKIGLDVALEALRDCWRRRRCSADDLWHYAKVCRVANVMRPYLESLA
jgi:predicted transcriptional regulator of viral defense system